MFHEPPDGFRAFDPHGEVTVYHRDLPHWRQRGATYFVTFRLADSLPQSKLAELREIRKEWRERHFNGLEPEPTEEEIKKHKDKWEQLSRTLMARSEKWLDQGLGSCVLKQSEIREIVVESLEKFDGKQYDLGAFVAMPNHVHLVMRPLEDNKLEDILQRRKQWTSTEINKAIGEDGALWQQESYDRIIRDSEHLWKTLQYIGNNSRKAGIDESESTRWVSEKLIEKGWKFVDE
ncbi:MAG: transposase [Verrucomicrobiales bacterium]|nr:transposase [Verrucomicrobiales bacterium]